MARALLQDYLKEIEKHYQGGKATEHTYRGVLGSLIEKMGEVKATNEPKRIACGAPDYVIERDQLTIGYVEAKDVGVSLDKIEKDEQLKRYLRALDNLVLTDYLEFRWYVRGERQMSARIGSIRNKKIVLDKDGVKLGEELLNLFLKHKGEKISKPQELAQRMARLAHLIRDIIIDAFEKKEVSSSLKGLHKAFQEVLLPELSIPYFADMFAQTIAYGLFAARYNHTSNKPFRREDAAREIPRTNPFLRKLFGTIAGPDLDDEPFVGFVDELAQVLAFTDMEAVLRDFGKRTRQEDPIVHFYETFLSQYDPKVREMRGVYYTPEPVVSYIVRSVDHLLREHFDCSDGLADTATVTYSYADEDGKKQIAKTPRVVILDPATGTGTFLYSVIAHIRETYRQMGNAGMWSGYVREHLLPRLFGFELLMAPYAMAHLKLGMQLSALDLPEAERKTWAYDFKTNERMGIYMTNTLDEAFKRSELLGGFGQFISDEANEAVKVKQNYPVMVVLGNPPYSYESTNIGKWITSLIRDYYEVDGKPLGERNPKGLQDDYVKFIRFAQWRIEQTGHGVLAFITNHGYLDNPTFRGMRRSLMKSFDDIYILDLHGGSKKKERSPDGSKDENVFDIQSGVAIGIFIKRRLGSGTTNTAKIHHANLWGPREVYKNVGQVRYLIGGKYHWLGENDVSSTEWNILEPRHPFYLFIPQNSTLHAEYDNLWKLSDIALINSVGIATSRDDLTIDTSPQDLLERVKRFASLPSESAREEFDLGQDTRDWQVQLAQEDLKQQPILENNIKQIVYRPFDFRFTYYTGKTRGFISMPRYDLIRHMLHPNLAIYVGRQGQAVGGNEWDLVFCGKLMEDYNLYRRGNNACFPLYLYPDPNKRGTLFDMEAFTDAPNGRRLNLAPTFTKDFATKLKLQFTQDGKGNLESTVGPEDIFVYMYAIFYSPTYRERYAEFLKIDFPRLPLTSNTDLFRKLCTLGERLVEIHLMEKVGKTTARYPINGNHVVEKANYTHDPKEPEKGRVWINKTQYFEGVPPEVWEFHVGGYQVCQKWLKDRKGRQLTHRDLQHYQRIVAALEETITLMEQIDDVIDEHGGWPIE